MREVKKKRTTVYMYIYIRVHRRREEILNNNAVLIYSRTTVLALTVCEIQKRIFTFFLFLFFAKRINAVNDGIIEFH